MLLLLPPSEGKAEPPPGAPVDPGALVLAERLGPVRERVIRASGQPVLDAPAAPAAEVYTGVLFAHLDFTTLPAAARRRAEAQVLIASGMWGLLRPVDRIPRYKLPIGEKVKRVKNLAALWRPPVAKALAPADTEGELILDCRSASYASVWRPARAALVEVRAFREEPGGERRPISHMAKASRGLVARAVLCAPQAPADPPAVRAVTRAAGIEAELNPVEGRHPNRWTLDVIER